jgi:succinoglycan biosynthesis transport protein ExoP
MSFSQEDLMTDPFEVNEPEPFESQRPDSRFSPFGLIARHYLLLILGAVVGGVVGSLYYARATPVYESASQILVVDKTRTMPVSDSVGSRMDSDSVESDTSTQLILLRSPAVVSAAVKRGNLTQLASFVGTGDPTGSIISSLKVTQEVGSGSRPSGVLNLYYRGTYAEDLPVILDVIVESYQQFLKKRFQNVTDETAKLIVQANEDLEKKLSQKQQEYDKFLAQLPTELWKGKEGLSTIQLQLMSLEAKRVELLNREADLQGRLQAIERAMKDGRHTRAELLTMISQAQGAAGSSKENAGSQTADRLLALKLQEKNLLEEFGSDHPEVRMVRDQLAVLNGRVTYFGKDSKNDGDPVESYFQALKLELEYVRMASESLNKVLQQAHARAKPLRSKEIQNESFRTEIARNQQLFEAISKRLDEINILKSASGGFDAEVINPPQRGVKVAPKAFSVFAVAIILGLVGGFGLAYLAEMSDQSFRTPEEIRRTLGLPVVGHIPFFPPEDKEKLAAAGGPVVDPSLCTFYRPKSREAEAIRGVRTALFFSRQGGHTLVQITSPDMGDGKSTVSSNLAVSIAQAEKKVILIDADFRRPRVHKLFNLSAEKGLASVISGEAELAGVIQTTAVPGLSILPCGPIPSNPAELLTLPRFREILESLRETYDYVLVDTPPLLAVTDPCTVVPYVDGVLLTVRISKNARPNATRAKEILASLGARVIGVVVNGVGKDTNSGYGSGYSYGGYRYGYGYSYKNYYTYSNYENEASSTSDAEEGEGMEETPDAFNQPLDSRRPSRKKTSLFAWLFSR